MSFTNIDYEKRYTYADYLKWTMEETVELIQGFVFRMASALSPKHQRVAMNLSGSFWNHFRGKSCQVFPAPFDVRLPRKVVEMDDDEIITVVQPDICIICDKKNWMTVAVLAHPI